MKPPLPALRSAPPLALAQLSVAGCAPFPALVSGKRAQPLAAWSGARGLRGVGSMAGLLAHWAHNAPRLAEARLDDGAGPLQAYAVHAPIAPRQAFCTIGNYRAQVVQAALDAAPGLSAAQAEASRTQLLRALQQRHDAGEPYAVLKPATAVAGPYAGLPLHASLGTLDWEVEIGAVIGRAARNVGVAQALSHVAGYCTVNDITLRERVFRADPRAMGTDFLQAKGQPGWLPVGPWLVPASQVAHPAALRLTLTLNGQPMQEGTADDMVFSIAEQVAYLSRHVQLEPGDLVCTGSPAGFGQHHGRYLRAGDVLEAEVTGLGRQRTEILACTEP